VGGELLEREEVQINKTVGVRIGAVKKQLLVK